MLSSNGKADFGFAIWIAATRGYAIVLCFAQWAQYRRYYKIADLRGLSVDVVNYRVAPAVLLGGLFEIFMLQQVTN